MSEIMKRIATLSIGLLIMITGYVRLFKKTKKQKIVERAKQHGDYVIGTCVKVTRRKSDGAYNYERKVKYEYIINGKKYYKTQYYDDGCVVGCKYPLEIKIYYDRNHPNKAYYEGEGSNRSGSCLGTILIAFLAMAIIYRALTLI